MNEKVNIPIDVLSYWYAQAKKCIERYTPETEYNLRVSYRADRLKEGYEMAVKTVDCLKGICEQNIEITTNESEDK